MNANILNFICFQLVWFACVYGGATNFWYAGPCAMILAIVIQYWKRSQWKAELLFLGGAGILGSSADAFLFFGGIYHFPFPSPLPWSYPLWMSALWVNFATSFDSSLQWLSNRFWLSVFFGFFGGPLSFYAGYRCNAITFHENFWLAMGVLGLFWAVMTPLLFGLRRNFEQKYLAL